jgi:uncharacterized protein
LRKLLFFLIALLAAFGVTRVVVRHALEQRLIVAHPQGPRTPGSVGLAYEDLRFPSGGHLLRGFYVPSDGPGLLIFHGNGESISSWVDAQKLLHDAGISSMVFDYSGFGSSQGERSLRKFAEDATSAWKEFRARLPRDRKACAYGLSLGSGILLEAERRLAPPPDCVAISGAFLSVREAAAQMQAWPHWALFLLPDELDNLRNVGRVPVPLLIEHGEEDGLFPARWARALAAAHPGAELAIVPGMGHADPMARPSASSWDPIIAFVRRSTTTPP